MQLIKRTWESKLRRQWERLSRIREVFDNWTFIKPFITHPILSSALAAGLYLVWSVVTSQSGPWVLLGSLATGALVSFLRNQWRFGSELAAIKEAATKPPEIQVETKYVLRDPLGWDFLQKVQQRNRNEISRLLQVQGHFEVYQQFDSTPPRILAMMKAWNRSIYRLELRSISGSVRFTDITRSGSVLRQIYVHSKEKEMPGQIEVLTPGLEAQGSTDLYLGINIAYQTTLEDLKAMLAEAESPKLDLHGLSIVFYAPDDAEVADFRLGFGDYYESEIKKLKS